MKRVVVTGSFDNLRSRQVRFLEEASRLGEVTVLVDSDACVVDQTGQPPRFPQAERLYFVQAIRYVKEVKLLESRARPDVLEQVMAIHPDRWVVDEAGVAEVKQLLGEPGRIEMSVINEEALRGFPQGDLENAPASTARKVIVSGCYDWLHSGHVRFFEEVSELGDLYVVVGNDENVRFLKGTGHPLFQQDERRYMVQSIRYVRQALISSGWDWLDYAPEVKCIRPDMFAVNEDGDKPEKRKFCLDEGIKYVVLKRTPKEGLPRRESTKLRGF
jgi:cytidyltransferase-like protein